MWDCSQVRMKWNSDLTLVKINISEICWGVSVRLRPPKNGHWPKKKLLSLVLEKWKRPSPNFGLWLLLKMRSVQWKIGQVSFVETHSFTWLFFVNTPFHLIDFPLKRSNGQNYGSSAAPFCQKLFIYGTFSQLAKTDFDRFYLYFNQPNPVAKLPKKV